MRLWSLHPSYLDTKGLGGLWREANQARNILLGLRSNYSNHPQMLRFKQHPTPLRAINFYMWHVFKESQRRGFNYNRWLIPRGIVPVELTVTTGQLRYEAKHLERKLGRRDPNSMARDNLRLYVGDDLGLFPEANGCFKVVRGEIAPWERPK